MQLEATHPTYAELVHEYKKHKHVSRALDFQFPAMALSWQIESDLVDMDLPIPVLQEIVEAIPGKIHGWADMFPNNYLGRWERLLGSTIDHVLISVISYAIAYSIAPVDKPYHGVY